MTGIHLISTSRGLQLKGPARYVPGDGVSPETLYVGPHNLIEVIRDRWQLRGEVDLGRVIVVVQRGDVRDEDSFEA